MCVCVFTGLMEQKGFVRDPGAPEPPAKDAHAHHGAHGAHGAATTSHGEHGAHDVAATPPHTEEKAGLGQKLKDVLHVGHKDHP